DPVEAYSEPLVYVVGKNGSVVFERRVADGPSEARDRREPGCDERDRDEHALEGRAVDSTPDGQRGPTSADGDSDQACVEVAALDAADAVEAVDDHAVDAVGVGEERDAQQDGDAEEDRGFETPPSPDQAR